MNIGKHDVANPELRYIVSMVALKNSGASLPTITLPTNTWI
ncbi:hypothetical protein [Leptospira borgpetersenii]|nr:hypothetical protein [Leptospira borgpetersenii]